MYKKVALLIALSILPICVYSQWIPEQLLTSPILSENDSNKLTVDAEVIGFMKNNEYFSPIVKGETFPGTFVSPKLRYQVDNKLRAELGVTSIFFSGEQNKEKTHLIDEVFIRLQYAIQPNFNLVFGNYYGGVNHKLIEPLYKWEDHFTRTPESGIQLIYEDSKYFFDSWLNWEQYIKRGDTVPEILTFGVSSAVKLSKPTSRLQLSIPLQLLINHRGGQIDDSDEKMVVAGNLATGICSEYAIENSFIKSIGLSAYAVGYYDKLPDQDLRPYENGWGVYPVLTVDANPFKFMTGYWHAKHFYSFGGEPLFGSFNYYYKDITLPNRNLLTTKLSFSKQLHKMIGIGAQIETYSDLNRGETDYSLGIYLRFRYSGVK